MKRPLVFIGLLVAGFLPATWAAEPKEIPLWPGVPPGSAGEYPAEAWEERGKNGTVDRAVRQVHRPTLSVFSPAQPVTGAAAVVIAPGGGYEHVTIDKEGYAVARRLNERGIVGVVLKYRLPKTPGANYTVETALADAVQALKVVRAHAGEWGIDPAKVGMMGFSAGGNLTALAATKPPKEERPAFAGLIYPSIPENFGEIPDDAPVAFIVQANDDALGTEHSLRYYQWMRAKKLSAELHLFPRGGHGFGLGPPGTPAAAWPSLFNSWLELNGFLASRK